MLLLPALLAIVHVGLAGSLPAAPENITITFLTPTSVKVSWQTSMDQHTVDKFDVTYKPTDARVVAVIAGNSEAVILRGLSPDTQYQLTVAAVWSGRKYRSRPIVFRTLELPRTSPHLDSGTTMSGSGPPLAPHAEPGVSVIQNSGLYNYDFSNISVNSTARELPTIRGVEIGIVIIVLLVWAGAIALFFNRWGKIRMLLPYQPDYKQEQLKVPGAGVCANTACNGQHSHQHFHQHWPVDDAPESVKIITERCQRTRINSAIFVSSEGRGFDSIEFIRRYGSQSVLCRKARSAENITAEDRNRRFSEQQEEWNRQDSCNSHSHRNDSIEMVECHNEPSTSKPPKLTNLPTLSISGPSPPHEEAVF